MGFFSRVKQGGGYLFNFKVTKWLAYDEIKTSSKQLFGIGRSIFTTEQANYQETFEQAMERLEITEEQLTDRRNEFVTLMFIYILIALAIFGYSLWIAFHYKNILGFFMGFCITIYALTFAFRYHFWIFQIKHKKLGCSLKDWFLDIH